MEMDRDMLKLSGALASLSKRGLMNLPGSGEALKTLKDVFKETSTEARLKMTYFMLLNTESAVNEDLKQDDYVSLFILLTPPIDKSCLVDYIYQLNLQSCFCTLVDNCPSAVTIEVVEVVIEKLKQPNFHKDSYGIEHLYELWVAVFSKLLWIEKGEVDEGADRLMSCFAELYKLIQAVITTAMKVTGMIEFVGRHLDHFLHAVWCCLTKRRSEMEMLDLFKLSYYPRSSGRSVPKPATKCIETIFADFLNIFEHLSVDIWMTLSECYLDAISAQRKIGHHAHYISEEIKNDNVPPNVLSCLTMLKIKPEEEELDKIAKAGLEEIIANTKDGKGNWFKALIRHERALEDKSITCIMSCLDEADTDDVSFLLDKTFRHLQKESSDLVKKLFLLSVSKLSEVDHVRWLGEVLSDYKPEILLTGDYDAEVVETFNKISKENGTDTCDVIRLCMQSPVDTLTKVCGLALCDSEQIEVCVTLLKAIRKACELPHPSKTLPASLNLLEYVLLQYVIAGDVTGKEENAFMEFVHCLNDFLSDMFFLEFFKFLKVALDEEFFDRAAFALNSLAFFLRHRLFRTSTPSVLVFMSRIMDHLCWDRMSFSTVKADLYAVSVDVVSNMMSFISSESPTDDKSWEWSRQEILKSWEVNQAYFCDLWFMFGRKWTGSNNLYSLLLTIVSSEDPKSQQDATDCLTRLYETKEVWEFKASVVLALKTLLPVSLFSRWQLLYDHLQRFLSTRQNNLEDFDSHQESLDIFASSLYLITLDFGGRSDCHLCYEHCLRNQGRLISSKLRFLLNVVGVTEKVIFCLHAIKNDEERKSCSLIFVPVLLELVDEIKKREKGKLDKDNVSRLVEVLNVAEVTQAVGRSIQK